MSKLPQCRVTAGPSVDTVPGTYLPVAPKAPDVTCKIGHNFKHIPLFFCNHVRNCRNSLSQNTCLVVGTVREIMTILEA